MGLGACYTLHRRPTRRGAFCHLGSLCPSGLPICSFIEVDMLPHQDIISKLFLSFEDLLVLCPASDTSLNVMCTVNRGTKSVQFMAGEMLPVMGVASTGL